VVNQVLGMQYKGRVTQIDVRHSRCHSGSCTFLSIAPKRSSEPNLMSDRLPSSCWKARSSHANARVVKCPRRSPFSAGS
jgi:hypothetical protein